MRLVDADELRDIYSSVPNGVYTTGHIITAIDECKTIDAAPVKHGRWECSEEFKGYKGCSVCDNWFIPVDDFGGGKWAFCPMCGAKMDLEG